MNMPRMVILVAVLSFAGCWLVPASGQAPTAGSIEGHVVNSLTGGPVRDAAITLRGPYDTRILLRSGSIPAPAPLLARTVSDDQGNFQIPNLGRGNYELISSRAGFMAATLGRIGNGIELLSLEPGQPILNVVVKLTPCSVVTGKITDAGGEPVQDAEVTVMQRVYTVAGLPRYSNAAGIARTDDHGIYRASGFAAGTYGLKIDAPAGFTQLRDQAGLAYTTTYYPDATEAAAMATFEVGPGATRNVDVKLRKSTVFHISGRTVGPDGLGKGSGTLQLLRKDGAPGTALGSVSFNSFDGNFEISGVPAGSYLMVVSPTNNSNEKLFARQAVDVAANREGIRVQLAPARQVGGSIRIEGKAAGSLQGTRIELCRLNATGGTPSAPVKDDLSFSLENVTLGPYTVCVTHLPAAYYVKSVLYDGKEVPATGFEAVSHASLSIVVSAAGASRLDGKVLDSPGKPATYALVTLFPVDAIAMSALTGCTDANGDFVFSAVRPGQYKVLAWESYGSALMLQGAGLESLKPLDAKSATVKLESGGRETVQLNWVSAEEKEKAFAIR
jgi:protocatechuate 3,4-dioxygenase beta subunit